MTLEKLEQDLNKKILNSIYLFYGEEQFLLESAVKKIKKFFGDVTLGINFIQIDDTNVNSLISEIQTPAFGYDKKLIIAKNTGLFKKEVKGSCNLSEKIDKYINDNIETIKDTVILVFIDEVEKKRNVNNLFKTIEENGIVCEFQKQKPIQISKRLKNICNSYRVNIDDATLSFFIEKCGTNMQILINEIRKLIEYAGENGTITKKDIEILSIKELDSVIFDLTDSLGKKDIKQALEILNELRYNKEPVQKILITLYGHFKKLYLTSEAIELNLDIAQSLSLKPNQIFLVNKYKMQAKYFSKRILRKILQELIDLDYNYKQGKIDINIGLEAILGTYLRIKIVL